VTVLGLEIETKLDHPDTIKVNNAIQQSGDQAINKSVDDQGLGLAQAAIIQPSLLQ